jgi:glycyl-tRNA synthetase beta chain
LILADRAEILVGIWGIGIRPTGDKDPFGLRRHALSLIKSFEVLGGRADRLLVGDLLRFAVSTFAPGVLKQDPVEELLEFIYERYFQKLAPLYGSNAVESVTALRPPLQEVIARVKAVLEFQKLEEASSLAAANKRVSNILKKAQNAAPGNVSPALLREPAELALFEALNRVAPSAKSAFDAKDYTRSLQALAALKGPVDTFFEKVMVNVDDAELRTNRLLLLGELASLMNRVADLGRSTA